MRVLLALVSLLSSWSAFASPDMHPAARQVLDLFKTNDVVFLGEIHHIHEQRSLLTAIAEVNGASHAFDALATESVLTGDQPLLDRYLQSGDEKELFIDAGWFNSVNIREAYRVLYKTRAKVCAVDVDFYWPDNPKREPELRERFNSFPADVQKLILKHADAKNLDELVKSQTLFDREYMMGVAIDACLKLGRKVLVHLGADHISSQDPVYRRQTSADVFDSTQWLTYINRNVRYTTVKNMINVAEDVEDADKALVAYFQSRKVSAPLMIASKDLPASIKKLMTEEGTENWRRTDYMILGPIGVAEKKVKPPKQ